MTADEKITLLAEIVLAIVRGIHDAAPDHCQCPLLGTIVCMYGAKYETLQEIAEDENARR